MTCSERDYHNGQQIWPPPRSVLSTTVAIPVVPGPGPNWHEQLERDAAARREEWQKVIADHEARAAERQELELSQDIAAQQDVETVLAAVRLPSASARKAPPPRGINSSGCAFLVGWQFRWSSRRPRRRCSKSSAAPPATLSRFLPPCWRKLCEFATPPLAISFGGTASPSASYQHITLLPPSSTIASVHPTCCLIPYALLVAFWQPKKPFTLLMQRPLLGM